MPPLEDPIEEAKRVIAAAGERKIILRLLGGVAFYFSCPSARHPSLTREYADLDFMGHATQTSQIEELFGRLDYVPRERFNALNGDRRLIFNDVQHERRADIILDIFEMCHKFDLRDRIGIHNYTMPLADLLATKLQIVEINERDFKDILCMLIDHEVSTCDSPETINGSYLAKLCADNWGVYRTFTMNLDRTMASLETRALDDIQKQLVRSRISQLRKMIDDAAKSVRWKMRARIGDRVKWYDLPEPDKKVV